MASEKMNEKAKRTNNLSPKKLCKISIELLAVHCLPEKNLYPFLSLTFSKNCKKIYSL
jgi:hypothetical protein